MVFVVIKQERNNSGYLELKCYDGYANISSSNSSDNSEVSYVIFLI